MLIEGADPMWNEAWPSVDIAITLRHDRLIAAEARDQVENVDEAVFILIFEPH